VRATPRERRGRIAPEIVINLHQIIPVLAVRDLQTTLDFYTGKLGAESPWTFGEPPAYGGVRLGGQQIHFAAGEQPASGAELYVYLASGVDEIYQRCREYGVEIVEPLERRGYNMRDFGIRDGDGIKLVFGEDSD
jgi:catechol 2,3-dioxygenase-like lactoylglutathione lyase family enzyme